jgi:hypothetical protein
MELSSRHGLSLTIPFLNTPWRTSLFSSSAHESSESEVQSATISARLGAFFQENSSMSLIPNEYFSQQGLIRGLIARIEDFMPHLTLPHVRKAVGLVPHKDVINGGYGVSNTAGGRFVDAYVSCVALDRLVASQMEPSEVEVRQSFHPLSQDLVPSSTGSNYIRHRQNIDILIASYKIFTCRRDAPDIQKIVSPYADPTAQTASMFLLVKETDQTSDYFKIISNILLMGYSLLLMAHVSEIFF